MKNRKIEILKKNIEVLSRHTVKEDSFVPGSHAPLPAIDAVKSIVSLTKTIIFTDYFYKLSIPVLPRIITELAHSKTGIDIHPGATIGDHFSIDHGTGVVIGETAIIGSHVILYQGVTLGAKSFKYDADGNMVNCPRHPILEDHVTVYSNSSILGRITIGHHSVVGGNIWLTHSIPPHSKILQSKAIDASFTGGLGI